MGHFLKDSSTSSRDPETERFRRIERRLKAGHWGIMDPRWWRNWTRTHTSFLIAMMFAGVALPLDLAFWDDEPTFGLVRFIPVGFFHAGLPALLLVNALLLDVLMVWQTRGNVKVRPGVRLVRLGLSSLPLLGLYAINFWQYVLCRRPPWAVRESASPDGFDNEYDRHRTPVSAFHRAASQMLTRSRVLSLSMLVWLVVGNTFFLVALSAKLNELSLLGGTGFSVHIFQTALHAAIFCCLVDYLRDHVRQHAILGWRRVLLWLLPWLALAKPFPFVFASVGAVVVFETGNARKRTLCWATHLHGGGTQRLASWRHLQDALDRSPNVFRHRLRTGGVGRSEEPGRFGRRMTAAYRLKTCLLGVDALALGWLGSRLAEQKADWKALIDNVVALLTWLALLGAGAALLLAAARTLLRSLGSPQRPTIFDAHAYGSLLALGLMIAGVGLNLGVWLQRGEVQHAAHLVTILICVGLSIAGLVTMSQPMLKKSDPHQEDRHDDGVWLVFFIGLAVASGLMAIDDGAARAGTKVLVATALLSPLWHLALAVIFREDWNRHGHPGRFLTATLVLPLGGFAVPYWIVTHTRRWLSHE